MTAITTISWLCVAFLVVFVYYTLFGKDLGGHGQSVRSSARESLLNILIGYGISFTSNALVLPMFGFHVTVIQNLQIGLIFTVISIARSFLIRRYFNALITGKKT